MNKTKTLTPSNSGRFTISGLELLQQNKAALSGLPPQLAPVVTLINAQKLRTYAIGTFQVPGIDEFNNRVWIEVEGKLTGNELAIWRPSEEAFLVDAADEFKPRYINLTDVKLEWGNRKVQDYDLKISQTFKESFLIKFNDPQDLHIWSAAICLSNFEFTSLNEAFTAVILSLKGKELSDIHILLSKQKRFPKSEWCNIRIPQISSKWIKVFVCIIPLDGKKKNGRIEMYLNDKMNKKNLILYVNRLHDIYNVYPEQPNMIDLNAIMKLDGEVYINKSYEPLFEHDQLWTTTLSQPPSRASSFAFKAHSRSGSLSSIGSNHNGSTMRTLSHTSTNSFFTNAPSPTKESFQIHTNTTPNSNSGLSSNFFKKEAQLFAITNCLYLMPVQHPGVPVIETMIRNFIEIIDAFKLYGRPEHLASDKFDTKSMLFGLPSLPRYKYLSMSEAVEIVKKSHKLAIKENWEGYDWRYVFKTYINNKQKETGFKGHGDILRLYKTFDTLQLDDYDYVIGDGFGNSPKLNLSESKPLSRDLLIELYNQDDGTETILLPSDEFSNQLDSGFNSIDNSRTNSGLADSPSDFNETIEFGAQLRAAAAKVKSSDHPYYNIVGGQTTSNEFANPISSSPLASSPFHSSPLRPKV